MKLLGKIESVFEISGRGTVIVFTWLSDLKVRNGDFIQLRGPSGKVRDTRIAAIEFVNRGPGKSCLPALMLPDDIARHDIAEGTEIWVPAAQEIAETS